MKRVATTIIGLIALMAMTGTASAALRVPQVVVNGGSLQGYLNSVGESIKLLFLTSSLANYKELLRQTELMGFEIGIIARKKLFFEELILVEAIQK